MKTFLIGILCLLCFTSVFTQQTNCPPNIDFESGDLSHWKFSTGSCCPIVLGNLGAPVSGQHELMSGGALDYYGLFPVVPPGGGHYVLKLGNDNVGSEAESAVYEFVVPTGSEEFSINYRFAVVFQDPGHNPFEQPRFEMKVYKKGSSEPINCGFNSYIATAALPGFKTSTVQPDVLYRDWSASSIDLTPYKGETILLEFSTGDCDLGGHFGYAYIDVSCSAYNVEALFCKGDTSYTLKGPEGYSGYYWYDSTFSTLLNSSNIFQVLPQDLLSMYNLIVEPFQGFGCRDTFKARLVVSDVEVTVPEQLGYCTDETIVLAAKVKSNSDSVSIQWYPMVGLSCYDCLQPTIIDKDSIAYRVEVTDSYGCKSEDSIYVYPNIKACCERIFIPNAFTPDKNGLNDIFRLHTETAISIHTWAVYNRWGERIWSSHNPKAGWDGRYQGEAQPLGVYFYVLDYTCLSNRKRYIQKGDVTLIR